MELVFLGHQSWLISHRSTNVLLDPLLLGSFGHSSGIKFQIYPPRHLTLSRMPKIDAVILSHEHLDHFHLPSLALLPRTTPIFTGTLTPVCVLDALKTLGFQVEQVFPFQPFEIGALHLSLYPGAAQTIFWEKRVNQLYIQPDDEPENGIFIAVDALVSEAFQEAVASRTVPIPRTLVCSNNSQIVPPRAYGAHSNLLPLQDLDEAGNSGVRLLYELAVGYLRYLPPVRELVICGNGFVDPSQKFGPFLFSDQRHLASLASELSFGQKFYGPLPGEKLNYDFSPAQLEQVDWVTLDIEAEQSLRSQQAAYLADPQLTPLQPLLGKFSSEDAAQRALEIVRAELPSLARAIMVSPAGIIALSMHEYLNGRLGPRRIVLRFLEGPGEQPVQFALDFSSAEFVLDETPVTEILSTYPFGFEIHLIDFAGVLEGELQIWDIAGTASRSWFIGDRYSNLISLLYITYGEQVRPDLASKVYSQALSRLDLQLDKL